METLIIDWKLWKKRCHNHQDLIEEGVATLKRELPEYLAALKQYVSENRRSQIRDILHTCLGALQFCGAPKLESEVCRFQQAAKNTKTDLEPSLTLFEKEVAAVLQALTEEPAE